MKIYFIPRKEGDLGNFEASGSVVRKPVGKATGFFVCKSECMLM